MILRGLMRSAEAGFSRAFSRRFGAPPLRWRNTVGRAG